MPRKIRSSEIETRTQRLKLEPRRKPYFVRIAQGLSLGYRKPRGQTDGTWVMRLADGKQGSNIKAVGFADDYRDADNDVVLTYDQATARVRKRASGEGEGGGGGGGGRNKVTVGGALDAYSDDLKQRGGKRDNSQRARKDMTPKLLATLIQDVKKTDWRKWRDSLAARKHMLKGQKEPAKDAKLLTPATVNRITTCVKAALNRIADLSDEGLNRHAWEVGLATLEGGNNARNVIIEKDSDVTALINASYEEGEDIGLLAHVCAETGARTHSQLAGKLLVANLVGGDNKPMLMVPVSKKGKGTKKRTHIPTPISTGLYRRLKKAAGQRKPSELLLLKADGTAWGEKDHYRPFKEAVKRAKLGGRGITMYAFRHTSIVRQLLANIPVRVVAVNHDTSVQMIERNYSVHIGDHTDEITRNALPTLKIAA